MSVPWQAELTGFRLQEVFGGNAVSDEYGIGRHVANLFVTQTYEGQSDIHGKFPIRMYPDGS
jgi:alkylation response protein AidB-like acyl-CoA dehydrogenase